jgi:ATP-dependent Clp protease ATP-binding subunit ClpC
LFERFTHAAKRVIALAQEEAGMLGHNYIGTEHILLGLVHEGDGTAARALESLNVSVEDVRREVEEIIGQGQAAPTGALPFTPRARKVLELSFRESIQLGHNYIGTEHILLGLLREGEGVAAEVLQKLGADLDRVRNRVRRVMVQGLLGPDEMPMEARRDQPPSPFEEREKFILMLLLHEGLRTNGIADVLGVSEEKVGEILQAIIEKPKAI